MLNRTRPKEELGTRKCMKKQTSGTFVKQVVFLTVNHRGPLPLRELHSTGETIVWRDPGGSWACLPPLYLCEWNHKATGCDMWTTPEKHTKSRTKPQAELYARCLKKLQRKHSELKEPDETLDKTKTLTIIARQKKAKEKALKWSSQTGKEPYENHSEKNTALQNAKKNNKTTKKKSSDRRRPS